MWYAILKLMKRGVNLLKYHHVCCCQDNNRWLANWRNFQYKKIISRFLFGKSFLKTVHVEFSNGPFIWEKIKKFCNAEFKKYCKNHILHIKMFPHYRIFLYFINTLLNLVRIDSQKIKKIHHVVFEIFAQIYAVRVIGVS